MNDDTVPCFLVTGGGGALGTAIAARLGLDHASVLGADLAPMRPDLFKTALTMDVGCEASVREAAAKLRSCDVRLDGFVCAAGVEGAAAAILDLPLDAFERVQRVNVTGVFLALKHFGALVRDGGSIVTISSTSGLLGSPNVASYVTSKHAVIGLTRAAAVEFAPRSIRVNCVAPGPVESPMMRSFEAHNPMSEMRSWYEAHTPLQRFGRSEEVAALVRFLLSEEASFINGAVQVIDGGLTSSGRPLRS